MINPASKLGNRLYNWKFSQAMNYVREGVTVTDDERELIEALDACYGNVGYFGGNNAIILRAAVETLIGVIEE